MQPCYENCGSDNVSINIMTADAMRSNLPSQLFILDILADTSIANKIRLGSLCCRPKKYLEPKRYISARLNCESKSPCFALCSHNSTHRSKSIAKSPSP